MGHIEMHPQLAGFQNKFNQRINVPDKQWRNGFFFVKRINTKSLTTCQATSTRGVRASPYKRLSVFYRLLA